MPIVIVLAYGCIAILSVVISGILSYKGLLSTAHEITPLLVVFIMGIVLIMDFAISLFRSNEKRISFLVVIFFIAAFFSMASNFNYLYSNFMEQSVTRETVTAELRVFRDDLVSTRSKVLEMDIIRQADERRSELELELQNIYTQIIGDTLRPGCGERCRTHMQNVERLAGATITDTAIPAISSSPEVFVEWFERYAASARETYASSFSATTVPDLRTLASDIDQTLLDFETVDSVIESRNGLDALDDMKTLSDDYERRANALLPDIMHIEHTDIDPTLGRLGEIAYAFENGFLDRPNMVATLLSLFLASIVDLLPFMLSFALFGPGRIEHKTPLANKRGKRGATVFASRGIRSSSR